MVTENYTMKEIIEEALVAFDLNRAIDQNDKAEVSKLFSIPIEQNILFILNSRVYMLVITDFGIYYEPNKILKTKYIFSFVLWNEIESVSKEMQDDFLILTLSTQEKEFRIFLESSLEPSLVSNLISYIITKKKNYYNTTTNQNIQIVDRVKQFVLEKDYQEAQRLLNEIKIDKETVLYQELLPLKIDIYKNSNNFYRVAELHQELKDFSRENVDTLSLCNREKQQNYNNYLKHFKELPLRERNIITVSNTDKLFKSEHITLLNINQLPEVQFPMSHPKNNQTYIAHPYKTDSYLPIENYDYELLNDRLNEFFYFLQCLGATSITFETIEEESKEENTHSNTRVDIEGKAKVTEAKVGVGYENAMNSSLRNYLKMERTQTFNPTKRPYIPNDLVWYPNEFTWQRLAQQRLNGNFLSHNEVLSSSQTQTLSSSEIVDVNAELKMLFTSVKADIHYQGEKDIKQNKDFSCRISVEFKPMEDFPEEVAVIDITPEIVVENVSKLSLTTDDEARYLEEVRFMLEDDGQIDERERTILERFRTRYNITPERAKELEAQAIASAQLTPAEQEYLEEYKNSLENGEISERERRLLNRLATALGIDEARVAELERKV
ncbi:hypothetical protein [Capnocytophaga sputigena]|uniref:hypothetical protein n=1 Tax=Capnocytophaga sputigena TaxID=1019 RepID=UPI0028E7A586|nr:hypothetical protein [Capnocytophaga sputigena]